MIIHLIPKVKVTYKAFFWYSGEIQVMSLELEKGHQNCLNLVDSSQDTESIYYEQIKSYKLFKKLVLNHFHGNQWSQLCNLTFSGIFNHGLFTWHTTKKHRKSWFWSKVQCHRLCKHTEWALQPQSRSVLNLTINAPCGIFCVQGKELGSSTGTEVTTTTGYVCGSSLATGLQHF